MAPRNNEATTGHSLRRLIAVGAACSALSSIATVVVQSKNSAETHVRIIAQAVAAPIRQDLEAHIFKADQAMAPGGVMHSKFAKVESHVEWLVKERICRTVPNQPCPALSDVVNGR